MTGWWGIQNKLCTTFIICTDVTFPLTSNSRKNIFAVLIYFLPTQSFLYSKVHSLLKQCFPWSFLGKIWGYFQLISDEISLTISWEYPQNVSSEDHRKHCFKNAWTLVGRADTKVLNSSIERTPSMYSRVPNRRRFRIKYRWEIFWKTNKRIGGPK